MGIRIVSLNIQHGGGKRIARLADWLLTKKPSVVVLPEWRNNVSGQQIRERLADNGYRTGAAARAAPKVNSIFFAAKDLTQSRRVTPSTSPAGDLVLIDLIQGIQILGCYFPQRQAKTPFFEHCIRLAKTTPDVPFVMIGDFNTGHNDLDIEGTGARFDCADLFEDLKRDAKLVDLLRARHGNQQEWTWRSSRNGFRIDHVFGNKAFVNRFTAFRCVIDHEPRLSGLTDHSAIVLETE
jgi:exonuclease III